MIGEYVCKVNDTAFLSAATWGTKFPQGCLAALFSVCSIFSFCFCVPMVVPYIQDTTTYILGTRLFGKKTSYECTGVLYRLSPWADGCKHPLIKRTRALFQITLLKKCSRSIFLVFSRTSESTAYGSIRPTWVMNSGIPNNLVKKAPRERSFLMLTT